jgi:hypothetical protein
MSTVMRRTNVFDGEIVSLPLIYNAGGTEVSTGFVLPTNAVIYPWEMFLLVDTVDSGVTVDVGILSTETGGDADGLIDGISAATSGLIRPSATLAQGTNAHYITSTTWGILFLPAACLGANVAEQNAVPLFRPYLSDGVAKTISYTPSASDTFVGRLVFRVHQYPV